MIYAVGVDTDGTFIHFLKEATRQGVPVTAINLRAIVLKGDWQFCIPYEKCRSYVSVSNEKIELDPYGSYYCRPIDLSGVQSDPGLAGLWNSLIVGFNAWLDSIPGIVINRHQSHVHNGTKPYHEAFLLSNGFNVPPSITTSNKKLLLQFLKKGRTIIKACSGIRADSKLIGIKDLERYDPGMGPVHVQRYIEGDDVRVHLVGKKAHAEIIHSSLIDYRNLTEDSRIEFAPHEIPRPLIDNMIKTSSMMGLIFTGWDFKLRNGTYWCLEANPMPGYDGYDRRCEGKITSSLIEYLNRTNKDQALEPL